MPSGQAAVDDRRGIRGILRLLKAGGCWCDVPPEHGLTTTVRIERLFCRLKHFRQIATRYDRLARSYLSALASWTSASGSAE